MSIVDQSERDQYYANLLYGAEMKIAFGPQLTLDKFREVCERGLNEKVLTPQTRLDLNSFALFADEKVLRIIMSLFVAAETPNKVPYCVFCKKYHEGGDTCMGHYP